MPFTDLRGGCFTCPLSLPGVRVGFSGFHPGERKVVSALLPHISITRRLQGRLLEPLRVVELRRAGILPQAGNTVSRRNVGKAGGLQRSQGRRRVNGVDRPAHVEAGRRTVAILIPLRSLVRAGVFKNLRGVVMIFPIHVWREPGAARGGGGCPFVRASPGGYLRPASAWTFQLYLPVAQLQSRSQLRTGVSLRHHVTARRPGHWFHCLLKTAEPQRAQFPGYCAACEIFFFCFFPFSKLNRAALSA